MEAQQTEWPYFSADELRCKCDGIYSIPCPGHGMDSAFMARIVDLRERLAFALPVTSAYRCPSYNNAVSHTGGNGPHTTGRAMDISVCGDRARRLIALAVDMGFRGIGVQQTLGFSVGRRFIHLDDIDTVAGLRLWSY